MAALTCERDTTELANGAKHLMLPVKGGVTIYQGAIVALDESGFAVPGATSSGLLAAGRAEATVENSGGDGALTVPVSRGVFVYDNTATAANKLTAAHVLKLCYMEDDQTVTSLATGTSVAGRVLHVRGDTVAVELGGAVTIGGQPV